MWHQGLNIFVQSHNLQFLQPKNRNLKGFHIDRYKFPPDKKKKKNLHSSPCNFVNIYISRDMI